MAFKIWESDFLLTQFLERKQQMGLCQYVSTIIYKNDITRKEEGRGRIIVLIEVNEDSLLVLYLFKTSKVFE